MKNTLHGQIQQHAAPLSRHLPPRCSLLYSGLIVCRPLSSTNACVSHTVATCAFDASRPSRPPSQATAVGCHVWEPIQMLSYLDVDGLASRQHACPHARGRVCVRARAWCEQAAPLLEHPSWDRARSQCHACSLCFLQRVSAPSRSRGRGCTNAYQRVDSEQAAHFNSSRAPVCIACVVRWVWQW